MSATGTPDVRRRAQRKLIAYVPLAIFLGLAFLFLLRLGAGVSRVPSALIGRPVPQTVLALSCRVWRRRQAGARPQPGGLHRHGDRTNVWASWCIPCHTEAPLLLKLAADKRIRVVGASTRPTSPTMRAASSAAAAIRSWRSASIPIAAPRSNGAFYGVPETFVIGRDGRIAYKLIGEITERNLEATLKPQIERHRPRRLPPDDFRWLHRARINRWGARNEEDVPRQLPLQETQADEAEIDLAEGTGKCNCTYCWKQRWWGAKVQRMRSA